MVSEDLIARAKTLLKSSPWTSIKPKIGLAVTYFDDHTINTYGFGHVIARRLTLYNDRLVLLSRLKLFNGELVEVAQPTGLETWEPRLRAGAQIRYIPQ
jgi:hypothetical protein